MRESDHDGVTPNASDPISQQLLEVINQVDDAVYIKDLDGHYLYANKTAAKLIGRPLDKIIGYSDSDLFPEAYLDQILQLDQQVLTEKQAISTESHYDVNGHHICFQTLLAPAYTHDQSLVGLVGVSRDITEQKELHEQLRHYSDELEIILNNSEDAIYRKDVSGKYAYINAAGAKMMKRSPAHIIGQSDSDLFGSLTTKKIRKTDREVIHSQQAQRVTNKYSDDQGEHWFNVTITPAYDADNQIVGIVGISKNITELKHLEMALREKNEQLTTILESSTDAIFAKDLEGRYLFINKACEAYMDKIASEVIGQKDSDLFTPDIYESLQAFDQQVIDNQQPISNTECFGSKGNESWYHATISPAYSSDGVLVGVIGISRNMTDYHRTQEQLWKSESRYYALYHDTPAIFITLDVNGDVVEANAYGAAKLGYSIDELKNSSIYNLIPPEDRNTFRRNLQQALDNPGTLYQTERRYIAKSGEVIWGKDFLRVVIDQDGNPSIPILSEDVTTAKQLSEQLNYRDTHDPLTGLFNRDGFNQRLTQSIQQAQANHTEHLLYVLELDDYKLVNDTCGPEAADQLTQSTAEHLRMFVRERDLLGKLSGKKFAVLMENAHYLEVEQLLEDLLKALRAFRFDYQDQHFLVSASIGAYQISQNTSDISFAQSRAEHAVQVARKKGHFNHVLYNDDDHSFKERQFELETLSNVMMALEHDLLELHAQKIVASNNDDEKPSYEVLTRMFDDNGELISPAYFIPILEQHHRAHELDAWVIKHTFEWLSKHREILGQVEHISINLSGQSLSNDDLLDKICDYFIEYAIPYRKVCFEITETAAISALSNAQLFLNTLRNLGCLTALDDFGAGLSSFRYLSDLAVDFVKIDGAFIRHIETSQSDTMLTQGMNDLVHQMGMKTVAEYVENETILEKLKVIGVDYLQGWQISKPVPLDSIILSKATQNH